jgi:hypothetical protein
LRTKIAVSTIGLLTTLAGCGGGETATTTTTTTGGHGGDAATTSSGSNAGGAGGAHATVGATGTGGGAAASTGSQNPGGSPFGAPCAKNGDCASLLCIDTDPTHSVCTRPCDAAAVCPPGPEWSCATKGGSPQTICQCQPSGPEVCDGQDNNCDGVVDEGDCPELVLAASGPIADLKLAVDKLVFVTDKTIEKVDTTPGAAAAVLRSNVSGVVALGVNSTSIGWIQGAFHLMDFAGNAAPDRAVTSAPPVNHLGLSDTFAYYADTNGTYVLFNALNKPTSYGPLGDLLLTSTAFYWYDGGKVRYIYPNTTNQTGIIITAATQPAPVYLAEADAFLYWGGASGAIRRAGAPAYTVEDLLTGEPGISGVTVDGNNVYWATSDSLTSTLWKLPIIGGAKAKIGGVTGVAHHLISAGAYVYFETGKLIWRSAK